MDSFKTKGWRGGLGVPEAQITTANGQTALRQDKEAARLPSTPSTISGAFHGTQREAMCPEMDLLDGRGLCPEGPIN